MFIRSFLKEELVYNTNGNSIVISPNTITFVSDELVTAKELVGTYGNRITILTDEEAKAILGDVDIEPVNDFLEGKTDEVPEGTVIVPVDEGIVLDGTGETEPNEEYAKEVAEAEAKIEAMKVSDSVDDAEKLNIMMALQEEAGKDDRVYDSVSLLKETEKVFAESRAKAEEELAKQQAEEEAAKSTETKEAPKKTGKNSKKSQNK